MKIFKTILKGLGILVLVLFVILAITYYKTTNYETYKLQVEKSYFPEVKTAADMEALPLKKPYF